MRPRRALPFRKHGSFILRPSDFDRAGVLFRQIVPSGRFRTGRFQAANPKKRTFAAGGARMTGGDRSRSLNWPCVWLRTGRYARRRGHVQTWRYRQSASGLFSDRGNIWQEGLCWSPKGLSGTPWPTEPPPNGWLLLRQLHIRSSAWRLAIHDRFGISPPPDSTTLVPCNMIPYPCSRSHVQASSAPK